VLIISRYSQEENELEFIIIETNGDKPLDEWLIAGIKHYAKSKYGVALDVWVVSEEENHEQTHAKE
jgi:hypothetical protein